jgi:hypothetical protein
MIQTVGAGSLGASLRLSQGVAAPALPASRPLLVRSDSAGDRSPRERCRGRFTTSDKPIEPFTFPARN